MTNTMRRDEPASDPEDLSDEEARPDLVTKRLKLYRRSIEDTDDDDPVPNDLWIAMDYIHLIAYATCYQSGYVRYISVVDGARRNGYALEMCLALNDYYRGELVLDNTDGDGKGLEAAFERESRRPWTPASAAPKPGLP